MAIKVERQIKQKGISKYHTSSGSSFKPIWKREEKSIPKEPSKNKIAKDLKCKYIRQIISHFTDHAKVSKSQTIKFQYKI